MLRRGDGAIWGRPGYRCSVVQYRIARYSAVAYSVAPRSAEQYMYAHVPQQQHALHAWTAKTFPGDAAIKAAATVRIPNIFNNLTPGFTIPDPLA